MTGIALPLLVGGLFAVVGASAERLASVWPAEEARRRPPGLRTLLLALAAGAAGGAIAGRSTLEPWATAAYLGWLALLTVLAATDLEQRRLPHLALDPLIIGSVVLAVFHPTLSLLDAALGAAVAAGILGLLGLVIRGGVAVGDLLLAAPIGLLLGWQAAFTAIFAAALLSAAVSLALLATRRVSLRSYIPFGPFLVAGAVIAVVRDPFVLGELVAGAIRSIG